MANEPKVTDLEPRLTPRFVSDALGVPSVIMPDLSRVSNEPFTSIVTDSRKIQAGCLFVALKGDKFDGHDFLPQAIAAGARGILCRRGAPSLPSAQKGLHIFAVEDSLEAYRKLAGAWRREFSIPMIAIAGSVGKTTTKEILAACLQGHWPEVLKTEGSLNGFVGIPITLLRLESRYGAAVIEVGIDEPGAMEQHMELVHATHGVLTVIGAEHLEKLHDIPTVAREEGAALLAIARSGGTVAINLDDPWIRPHFSTLKGCKKFAYTLTDATLPSPGNSGSSSEPILRGKLSENGKSLTVNGAGMTDEEFALPLPGEHNARNLLAAVTVAVSLGVTADEIRRGLKTFRGAQGRSEIRELPGRTPVVCDYYNANPDSTEAGIKLLTQAARDRQSKARFACLADMLELGPKEETFHRALAASLISSGIENVLLYGDRMKWLHGELTDRGYRGSATHFTDQQELARALITQMKPGDAILIKGSHSMRMEEVWQSLEKNAQASDAAVKT